MNINPLFSYSTSQYNQSIITVKRYFNFVLVLSLFTSTKTVSPLPLQGHSGKAIVIEGYNKFKNIINIFSQIINICVMFFDHLCGKLEFRINQNTFKNISNNKTLQSMKQDYVNIHQHN